MNEKKKTMFVIGIFVFILLLIMIGILVNAAARKKTMETFKETFASESTEIIYLGRPGCSHCIAFKPILEKVLESYHLSYLDINTDQITKKQLNEIIDTLDLDPERFGTPTTVIVKDKKVIGTQIGETTEEALISLLKEKKVISE